MRAIANALMAQAVRLVTVERGYDPRDFIYLAFGGAGPVHAVELARELQMPRVVLPPMPGLFSAFGMLVADMLHDLQASIIKTLDELTPAGADRALRRARGEGARADARRRGRSVARQDRAPRRLLLPGAGRDAADPDPRRRDHARRRSTRVAQGLRARAPAALEFRAARPAGARGEHPPARRRPDRPAHHRRGCAPRRRDSRRPPARQSSISTAASAPCRAIAARTCAPGDTLEGPLVVEEPSTRLPIDAGDRLHVDADRNLVVDVRR